MENIENTENRYKISSFAKKVGVSIGTVRNWQKKNLLPDRRSYNKYRYFTDEDVQTALRLLNGN